MMLITFKCGFFTADNISLFQLSGLIVVMITHIHALLSLKYQENKVKFCQQCYFRVDIVHIE